VLTSEEGAEDDMTHASRASRALEAERPKEFVPTTSGNRSVKEERGYEADDHVAIHTPILWVCHASAHFMNTRIIRLCCPPLLRISTDEACGSIGTGSLLETDPSPLPILGQQGRHRGCVSLRTRASFPKADHRLSLSDHLRLLAPRQRPR